MSATRPPVTDERSTGSVEASRRGAHRARAKAASVGLPVLAGILVVVAAVGGAWLVFAPDKSADKTSASVEAAVGNDDGSDPAASIAASGAPKASASASQPVASQPAASQKASAPASSAPVSQTIDRKITLAVLNSVPVQGLAKKVSATLTPKGWTVGRTGNSIQKNLAATKVYYGSKAKRATALALVKDMGFGTAVADASAAKGGLVVVLGQDAV